MSTAAIVVSVSIVCLTLVGLGILWMLVRRHEQALSLQREALDRQQRAEQGSLTQVNDRMTRLDARMAGTDQAIGTYKTELSNLAGRVQKLESTRLAGR